jgi:hypothetical protein
VFPRGLFHLHLEPAHHLLGPALQEQAGVLAGLPIAGEGRDLGHAGGQAAADLVLEAGPRPAAVQHLLARPHAEELVHHARGLPSQQGRDVGAAIGVAVFGHPAHHVQPGILLRQRELEVGVVLVVPQQHVVARPVALDQVVLEGQRLHVGVHEHQVEVRDLRGHVPAPDLDGPAGLEVRADAVAQAPGLAHVDHGAVPVLEEVDPGLGGNRLQLLLQAHD